MKTYSSALDRLSSEDPSFLSLLSCHLAQSYLKLDTFQEQKAESRQSNIIKTRREVAVISSNIKSNLKTLKSRKPQNPKFQFKNPKIPTPKIQINNKTLIQNYLNFRGMMAGTSVLDDGDGVMAITTAGVAVEHERIDGKGDGLGYLGCCRGG
ncbi:hypothetical protein DVH24_007655 [Malus domestica]|uniref:Uncharacterized protein n=1 Tax=Malus domestica TaxID=3750 RepID=A0A498HHC5_MALDO|nr:hypothetical protein DVH24_007655 [Malus domestica]